MPYNGFVGLLVGLALLSGCLNTVRAVPPYPAVWESKDAEVAYIRALDRLNQFPTHVIRSTFDRMLVVTYREPWPDGRTLNTVDRTLLRELWVIASYLFEVDPASTNLRWPLSREGSAKAEAMFPFVTEE